MSSSNSLNNPLRFLFGWFAVTPHVAPPVSILLAYWFGGAFLMAAKRVSEHRAIVEAGGTASLAAYRPSFAVYTQSSLVTSCLVYAQGLCVHDGDLPVEIPDRISRRHSAASSRCSRPICGWR